MKYGPETETVEAFLRHLKGMTPEQWAAARDAAVWKAARYAAFYAARDAALDAAMDATRDAAVWNSAMDAAWDAARDAARYAARDAAVWDAASDAAWDAVYEIFGAAIMRERGQPFYLLPMFGFADPEAVLENDKKRAAG